ncbi:hypothetical protein A2982_01095 [candidate division WWE3 bacterium RIFCSPLOWO2_01_FULL_39_13]|uniref:HEPN domain-containing protein n=1 Tax=candidate division WWE3 bacterium RIFCSPLOWO2_01_FULL_39_13 TaxID=1802624 RepID=A0A1F4V364_UNCKA|nr:MAG: hypothetical protein A2982_01095 [candidate division WWE3 bacterium RIFCSPLOWO2_01_FULL_39_13]
MMSLYNQAKFEENEYREKKNCAIHYKYVKRDQYPLYGDINKLAGEILAKVRNVFKVIEN